MDSSQPLEDELLRLTGNPKLARALREGLQRVSTSRNHPELAEMAGELLAGRTSLREVGRSDVYGGAIAGAFDRFRQWQSQLPPEEREELERKTREEFGTAGQ